MTRYVFHKMHGLGNDFILIDARRQTFTLPPPRIAAWSDRHTGIGCDQWLIVEPSRGDTAGAAAAAHASYRVFNADGSSAEQCLNGLRCIGWYLHRHDGGNTFVLDSPGGHVTVSIAAGQDGSAAGQVRVELPPPTFGAAAVGWQGASTGDELALDLPAAQLRATAVSMGNPHAVAFVTEARAARARHGVAVSTHQHFAAGCNAGFAQVEDAHHLFLAVFERGSGPTRACGSGAAAAAVAALCSGRAQTPVQVRQPGGSVMVDWQGNNQPVRLTGPAESVFSGEFVDDTNG